MAECLVFCEDAFHERLVTSLIHRLADQAGVVMRVRPLSARGGFPRMQRSLRQSLHDIEAGVIPMPRALVTFTDTNCKGARERRKRLETVIAASNIPPEIAVFGLPDPHIERWMLVDSQAFRAVFGQGNKALPGIKRERDEYKRMLLREIGNCGIDPPLGGMEYADDIVNAMDLDTAIRSEESLKTFVEDLKRLLSQVG